MPTPTSDPIDPLELYIQAIKATEQQNAIIRSLTEILRSGLEQTRQQNVEVLVELRASRTWAEGAREGLASGQDRLSLAIEARTALIGEMTATVGRWLQQRWLSLLIGLAAGLGLAGGNELLGAVLGRMLGGGNH